LQELLPKLSIVNIVATAELKQFVNLEKLKHVEGFLYDTAVYRCAYLKDKRTRGKVHIFTTGKMICVGARSFDDAKHDLRYAAKRLAALGLIKPTNITIKLRNIVAIGELGRPIDLEELAKLPNVIYEPEQFPGAMYWAPELEGAAMLLFPLGKVVIAGLKRHESLVAVQKLLERLTLLT